MGFISSLIMASEVERESKLAPVTNTATLFRRIEEEVKKFNWKIASGMTSEITATRTQIVLNKAYIYVCLAHNYMGINDSENRGGPCF